MSFDRVLRPGVSKATQKFLKSEVSRAFGLWIVAAIICLAMSFAWMSVHYDPNRAALAGVKHDTASVNLGSMSEPSPP
jgi:hypothetical protein